MFFAIEAYLTYGDHIFNTRSCLKVMPYPSYRAANYSPKCAASAQFQQAVFQRLLDVNITAILPLLAFASAVCAL